MIMFACVSAIHMGLIPAIEKIVWRQTPILSCPKCMTFWFVLFYSIVTSHGAIVSISIAFLASYLAIWLELLFGFIDTQYNRLYEKIYSNTENDTASSDTADGDTDNAMS